MKYIVSNKVANVIARLNRDWKAWLRTRGKDAFVLSLPQSARLFDVGCGNDSPRRVKNLRADIWYIGLDVQDYEQRSGPLKLDSAISGSLAQPKP